MTFLAEIEPGFIFMVLIWLFSSFFSKKGKKKGESTPKKKVSNFENLMKKLGELPNMDMNQAQPFFSNEKDAFEDEFVEPELYFEDVEVEEPESIQEEVITEPLVKRKNLPAEIKLFGTPLQKAMVLKEILDKPRALRPFNF
ncbi:MAG: hypothetical protein H8E72_04395 [Candidatus Marinimicrobia bacterium]|nr:hypothetical protein [Candidatus Neomarinimicrobiota bacterium]